MPTSPEQSEYMQTRKMEDLEPAEKSAICKLCEMQEEEFGGKTHYQPIHDKKDGEIPQSCEGCDLEESPKKTEES